jgi:hypothetical protein
MQVVLTVNDIKKLKRGIEEVILKDLQRLEMLGLTIDDIELGHCYPDGARIAEVHIKAVL